MSDSRTSVQVAPEVDHHEHPPYLRHHFESVEQTRQIRPACHVALSGDGVMSLADSLPPT